MVKGGEFWGELVVELGRGLKVDWRLRDGLIGRFGFS